MKPKLAFCFRGICKNFHPLYENYKKHIIDPLSTIYDIDFYLSTAEMSSFFSYRSSENNDIFWDSILQYFNFTNKIILSPDDPTLSLDILKFVNDLIDKNGGNWGETSEGWSDQQSRQSTYFVLKNLYSVYLLKNIIHSNYDKYLVTRQDLFFHNTIDVDRLKQSDKDIMIPSVQSYGGYCDRFAIMNKKAFDVYVNRYSSLRYNPIKYHEENYLKHECLDKKDVSVDLLDNFDFTAIRSGSIGDTQLQQLNKGNNNMCIARTSYYDRSAMLQLTLEYQDKACNSTKFNTYIFIDPHKEKGYVSDYDNIIGPEYKRINWSSNAGKYNWFNAVKYIFDNTHYEYVLSIEDDVIISKDYLNLCQQIINDNKLKENNNILYFHIGAWQKPRGNPNKIVRSSASSRSILIHRNKFKIIEEWVANNEIIDNDHMISDILTYHNMITIAPEMNRHGHIGIYGWSSNNVFGDDRGQSAIFENNISHKELYESLKSSCLCGKSLLYLNKNKNLDYFWDFNTNINFSCIEYQI